MKLLALESAYDICGAAIFDGADLIALEEVKSARQHNKLLASLVGKCVAASGLSFDDLDGVAVSSGPGSYTGLRIGNSYAKGLAFGGDLSLIPVPTLNAMSLSVDRAEVQWLVTWSHGQFVYVLDLSDPEDALPKIMTWDEFYIIGAKSRVAGYQIERFLEETQLDCVEVCPSASNVGKFAILKRLVPTENIASLLPYYYQNMQIEAQ